MALVHKHHDLNCVKFKLDDEVCFIPDETKEIRFGKIVRIRADICIRGDIRNRDDKDVSKGKNFLTYTIEDEDKNIFNASFPHVYATKEELFKDNGLKEYHCDVFLDHCSSLYKNVIATSLEDTIASLKEEFPQAKFIREAPRFD